MYYIGYSMSPTAEKKRRQLLNMTAEKRHAKKDKSKIHMRSVRLVMTIDERKKMEMNRRRKEREWNSMSFEEKDKMHLNARDNIQKLCLVMSN
jgi:hypothetical protein